MVAVAFLPGILLYNLRVDVPGGARLYRQRVRFTKGLKLRLSVAPSAALVVYEDADGQQHAQTVRGIPAVETITTIYTGRGVLRSLLVRGSLFVIFAQLYDGVAA